VHFGEVSLSGAVNATPLMAPRLKEAQKLGFREALLPAQGELDKAGLKLAARRITHLRELADDFAACD
jgi:DNA repair protein RadA/Sms